MQSGQAEAFCRSREFRSGEGAKAPFRNAEEDA
jgi:hypothetical protein